MKRKTRMKNHNLQSMIRRTRKRQENMREPDQESRSLRKKLKMRSLPLLRWTLKLKLTSNLIKILMKLWQAKLKWS